MLCGDVVCRLLPPETVASHSAWVASPCQSLLWLLDWLGQRQSLLLFAVGTASCARLLQTPPARAIRPNQSSAAAAAAAAGEALPTLQALVRVARTWHIASKDAMEALRSTYRSLLAAQLQHNQAAELKAVLSGQEVTGLIWPTALPGPRTSFVSGTLSPSCCCTPGGPPHPPGLREQCDCRFMCDFAPCPARKKGPALQAHCAAQPPCTPTCARALCPPVLLQWGSRCSAPSQPGSPHGCQLALPQPPSMVHRRLSPCAAPALPSSP